MGEGRRALSGVYSGGGESSHWKRMEIRQEPQEPQEPQGYLSYGVDLR